MKQAELYKHLIQQGKDLLGVDDDDWVAGYNVEYDRAIVEFIIRSCGLSHNDDTDRVCADLGITLDYAYAGQADV